MAFNIHDGLTGDMRLILVLCAMALAFAQDAAAETRIALVIGNSSYSAPLRPLKNPANDAADVAASLRKLGFEVMLGIDLKQSAMTEMVARYTQAAREADVSLFYYAGHGFQMASRNYLVPVDAVLRSRDDITRQTLDLRAMIEGIEGARGIHLVFLDACRNDPLPSNANETISGIPGGLARVGDAAGFLIAFATQPNNVAYDGTGRNSPFTQAILSHIGKRGQDIASMMIAVRRDVLAATGGFQRPFEESSIDRQFYFAPGASEIASPETQLWQLAASARDPDLMRIYLERYPEGAHVKDVRSYLQVADRGPPDTAVRSTPSAASLNEDRLWDVAWEGRTYPLVDYYLKRYPNGRHAAEARALLSTLPRAGIAGEAPEAICERLATHPRDATANTAGTPFEELVRDAEVAIEACGKAVAGNPGMPHFVALMARAMTAAGRKQEAIRLYRDAAERGNLRALVSLGLITETGDGVPKDVKAAMSYYERAAEGGSPDGAINLAVALIGGGVVKRDVPRAVELLSQASAAGSAIATYNLGALAQDGVAATPEAAIGYFRKAAELGESRAFVAAAILLDEGRGVRKDPTAAAEMLLRGVTSDSGEALNQIANEPRNWSPDTIRTIQAKLKQGGYYSGPVNGRGGPALSAALKRWRSTGNLDLLRDG